MLVTLIFIRSSFVTFAVWAAASSACLPSRWGCGSMRTLIDAIVTHPIVTHPIEVAFESIQVSGPEPPELSQPGIHLLEWPRLQPVETALCVHRGFHETGLAQHSQVLGHGRLRHTKSTLNLSHRLLGRDQEAQYRAAVRLRNDFERRFHALDILHHEYTCQGIYEKECRRAIT